MDSRQSGSTVVDIERPAFHPFPGLTFADDDRTVAKRKPSTKVHIGTSGYHFMSWKGVLYPKKARSDELLVHYAHEFDTVEINTTYYGIPSSRVFERMVTRTPDHFTFSVKAPSGVTHHRENMHNEVFAFRNVIRPLSESGKLIGVLAQFPNSFRGVHDNCIHILRTRDLLQGLPLFIEFRHVSWCQSEVRDWLRNEGMGFVCVDVPSLLDLFPSVTWATSKTGYVRLHGRNAEQWYAEEKGASRYDYPYNDAELRGIISRLDDLARVTQMTYVYFNNCYLGRAVVNARRLMRLTDKGKGTTQE